MPDDQKTPAIWQYKVVQRVLSSYTPPAAQFDPAGAWEHTYNIYFLNIRAKKGKGKGAGAEVNPNGILKLSSAPKGGEIELLVESTAFMTGDQTSARIRCKNDALRSPLSWEISFTNQSPTGKELVTFSKTGAVENGVLMKDGKPAKGMKPLSAYTCDWSLFDAVQRLTLQKSTAPLTFDMIEYLDVLRENQTLRSRGATPIPCAGGNVDAQEYLQFGDAVLPTHYYVDAGGRLFMALGSRRLFVLVDEKA
ncbi:MAG: hypothetical protein NTW86_09755 [Candidatus Sumerlaeota bacterium]|nr:hypothetical protein [Candidatus Sumerlaeota bacterium]